jgi:hypothetical protein
LDAVQDLGDVERSTRLLEYVESHVHLRQTFEPAPMGGHGFSLAKAADRAELCFQRGFKDTEDEIFGFIVHGGLLSIGSREG